MACIQTHLEQLVILADTDAEKALLDHGRHNGSRLILLEAQYVIVGDLLLLPERCTRRAANRVRQALEQAAQSHQEAQRRRRKFRLI